MATGALNNGQIIWVPEMVMHLKMYFLEHMKRQ